MNDPESRIDERGQGQITYTEFEKLFADDAVTSTTDFNLLYSPFEPQNRPKTNKNRRFKGPTRHNS